MMRKFLTPALLLAAPVQLCASLAFQFHYVIIGTKACPGAFTGRNYCLFVWNICEISRSKYAGIICFSCIIDNYFIGFVYCNELFYKSCVYYVSNFNKHSVQFYLPLFFCVNIFNNQGFYKFVALYLYGYSVKDEFYFRICLYPVQRYFI